MDIIDVMSGKFANAINFTVIRNGETIGSFLGNKVDKNNRKAIDFIHLVNVRVGDILIEEDTETRYQVVNLEKDINPAKHMFKDNLDHFFAYIITDFEKDKFATNYNISAHSSVIAINSNNISATIGITDFQKLIDDCAPEDRIIGYELLKIIKDLTENKEPIKRKSLSKFGDFLAKYSPVAIGLGQILISILL